MKLQIKLMLQTKLKKKLSALKFLCSKMSVEQRKKLADGIIMSRILYRITVWGNMVPRTHWYILHQA